MAGELSDAQWALMEPLLPPPKGPLLDRIDMFVEVPRWLLKVSRTIADLARSETIGVVPWQRCSSSGPVARHEQV